MTDIKQDNLRETQSFSQVKSDSTVDSHSVTKSYTVMGNGDLVPGSKSLKSYRKGNLYVDSSGKTSYKNTASSTIMSAVQLGITCAMSMNFKNVARDVLMQDFFHVELIAFPGSGSKTTPVHEYPDFTIKNYSPVAFRYFRNIFGIAPQDFLTSFSGAPLRELSSSGASGSLFFTTSDDLYVLKTVDKREAEFLQGLLPGYYMNLHQNSNTLLPKYFGLYCYNSLGHNIRLIIMNNLLPSKFTFIHKFDIKGSTFKRRASQAERSKKTPTLKDLNLLEMYPKGFIIDQEYYETIMSTLERDARVLQSFKIMDYSLLIGVMKKIDIQPEISKFSENEESESSPQEKTRNSLLKAMHGIRVNSNSNEEKQIYNGIPAVSHNGESLMLFIGIIDILQNYRFVKKIEHNFKAIIYDGDTISVHHPRKYAKRFLDFCKANVFRLAQNQNTKGAILHERLTIASSPNQLTNSESIQINNRETDNTDSGNGTSKPGVESSSSLKEKYTVNNYLSVISCTEDKSVGMINSAPSNIDLDEI